MHGSVVKVWTDRQTDRQTDTHTHTHTNGSDSMTSTADVGGNKIFYIIACTVGTCKTPFKLTIKYEIGSFKRDT